MGANMHGGGGAVKLLLGTHTPYDGEIYLARQLTQNLNGESGLVLSPSEGRWSPEKTIKQDEVCLADCPGGLDLTEHAARAGNAYLEGAFCAFVREGKLDLSIKGPHSTDVPMRFTQEFNVDYVGLVGYVSAHHIQ